MHAKLFERGCMRGCRILDQKMKFVYIYGKNKKSIARIIFLYYSKQLSNILEKQANLACLNTVIRQQSIQDIFLNLAVYITDSL